MLPDQYNPLLGEIQSKNWQLEDIRHLFACGGGPYHRKILSLLFLLLSGVVR